MSFNQFWHESAELVVAYAKANEICYNRRELDLWKTGYYVLRATSCLWDKNATYPEEPVFMCKDERDEELHEKHQMQDLRKWWEMWATECNDTLQSSQKLEQQ